MIDISHIIGRAIEVHEPPGAIADVAVRQLVRVAGPVIVLGSEQAVDFEQFVLGPWIVQLGSVAQLLRERPIF